MVWCLWGRAFDVPAAAVADGRLEIEVLTAQPVGRSSTRLRRGLRVLGPRSAVEADNLESTLYRRIPFLVMAALLFALAAWPAADALLAEALGQAAAADPVLGGAVVAAGEAGVEQVLEAAGELGRHQSKRLARAQVDQAGLRDPSWRARPSWRPPSSGWSTMRW